MLTDSDKGAIQLAIGAAVHTVQVVASDNWGGRLAEAYGREWLLVEGLPEHVKAFSSRLRDEGQYGY